tara:strand:+ start:61 stop:597 length:537 start_codon:yes stop_codon:yes gene_type:complete
MPVTISVPHNKSSGNEPSIVPFMEDLQSILELKDIPYYTVRGNSLREMIDLSTSQARGTSYNKELSAAFDASDLHIEVHAYDFDSNPDWTDSDVVIGDISGYTDDEMITRYEETIAEFGNVSVVDVVPLGHYSTALAELVYEMKSLILYVNADSGNLFQVVSEAISDVIVDYEDRRTS